MPTPINIFDFDHRDNTGILFIKLKFIIFEMFLKLTAVKLANGQN